VGAVGGAGAVTQVVAPGDKVGMTAVAETSGTLNEFEMMARRVTGGGNNGICTEDSGWDN